MYSSSLFYSSRTHYVKSSLIWLTAIHTPTIFLLMLNVSSAQEIAKDPLWTCVCMKYGFGQPHRVSKSMWYRHLALATTENEKQHIRAASRLKGRQPQMPLIHILLACKLPNLANHHQKGTLTLLCLAQVGMGAASMWLASQCQGGPWLPMKISRTVDAQSRR